MPDVAAQQADHHHEISEQPGLVRIHCVILSLEGRSHGGTKARRLLSMNLRVSVSPWPVFLLDFDERNARLHQLAHAASHPPHPAVVGCGNGEFHLHRLEDDKGLAGFHILTGRHVDGYHRCGHRRGKRRLVSVPGPNLRIVRLDDEHAPFQKYPRRAAEAHGIGEPPAGIGHELIASGAEAVNGHSRVLCSVDHGSSAFALRASADKRGTADDSSRVSPEVAPAIALTSAGGSTASRARSVSASASRKCVSTSPLTNRGWSSSSSSSAAFVLSPRIGKLRRAARARRRAASRLSPYAMSLAMSGS